MNKIRYVEGDLIKKLKKFDFPPVCVPHVVNNAGVFGAGFARVVDKAFPQVKGKYLQWFESGYDWDLGNTQFVNVPNPKQGEDGYPYITFANMIAQTLTVSEIRPLQYNKLSKCMDAVYEYSRDFDLRPPIWTVLFGSGLAGGDPAFVEQLMIDCWTLRGLDVTVFYMKDRLTEEQAKFIESRTDRILSNDSDVLTKEEDEAVR